MNQTQTDFDYEDHNQVTDRIIELIHAENNGGMNPAEQEEFSMLIGAEAVAVLCQGGVDFDTACDLVEKLMDEGLVTARYVNGELSVSITADEETDNG